MSHQVHILETDETFSVNEDESILEGAFRANIKLAHECQFGACGTCRIKLVQGNISYEEFPMGLTEEEAAQGYALACQARPTADLTISGGRKLPSFEASTRIAAQIHKVQAFSQDVVHLTLQLTADQACVYRPGQYMNIILEDGTTRSFSMASASPQDNLVEFHVRKIKGGRFTEHLLTDMSPGAPLSIEIPLGTFCYHEEDWRPLIMVATGTGIAPIKAILESLLDQDDCPPICLYWGMGTEEDLYLGDTFESWKDRLYEFEFIPVLSRASADWSGRRGYVQHAVAQDFTDMSEHAFYLCGSPNMIVEAKSLFARQGGDVDYMYADSFNFQHSLELSV